MAHLGLKLGGAKKFLGGEAPSAADASAYAAISAAVSAGKLSLGEAPAVSAWAATIALFTPEVRAQWK